MGTLVTMKPRYSLRRIDPIIRLLRMGMTLSEAERAVAKDPLYSMVACRSSSREKEKAGAGAP